MTICYTLYDDNDVQLDSVAVEMEDDEAMEEFASIKSTLAQLAEQGELEEEDGPSDSIFEDD